MNTTAEAIKNLVKEESKKDIGYRTDYKLDSKDRFYEMRKGYRVNGPRKTRLINRANLHLAQLGAKGVNIHLLLRLCGITGDAFTITTKQWSGVIGQLKKFRKENNL